MQLFLDMDYGASYRSKLQQMRVITEHWAENNLFCPRCGNSNVCHYDANKPVADFYCPKCQMDYELKSKGAVSRSLPKKIVDGEYHKMISRISANNNPNFIFMTHDSGMVNNLVFVPNFFFTGDYIEKRPPLPSTARRAGWVGCKINFSAIPQHGKIFMVENRQIIPAETVLENFERIKGLYQGELNSRNWLFDVLKCVENIPGNEFSLQDVYAFEASLSRLHKSNHNIKAKIRQQLQFLRDKGIIAFSGKGYYRKCTP